MTHALQGIIFSVRPPKKSWKNIANLSGGEKTLSSLSLVFALHHFRPTPLYVMDEIDAALGENCTWICTATHLEQTFGTPHIPLQTSDLCSSSAPVFLMAPCKRVRMCKCRLQERVDRGALHQGAHPRRAVHHHQPAQQHVRAGGPPGECFAYLHMWHFVESSRMVPHGTPAVAFHRASGETMRSVVRQATVAFWPRHRWASTRRTTRPSLWRSTRRTSWLARRRRRCRMPSPPLHDALRLVGLGCCASAQLGPRRKAWRTFSMQSHGSNMERHQGLSAMQFLAHCICLLSLIREEALWFTCFMASTIYETLQRAASTSLSCHVLYCGINNGRGHYDV